MQLIHNVTHKRKLRRANSIDVSFGKGHQNVQESLGRSSVDNEVAPAKPKICPFAWNVESPAMVGDGLSTGTCVGRQGATGEGTHSPKRGGGHISCECKRKEYRNGHRQGARLLNPRPLPCFFVLWHISVPGTLTFTDRAGGVPEYLESLR